jgi:hypothetical protein
MLHICQAKKMLGFHFLSCDEAKAGRAALTKAYGIMLYGQGFPGLVEKFGFGLGMTRWKWLTLCASELKGTRGRCVSLEVDAIGGSHTMHQMLVRMEC